MSTSFRRLSASVFDRLVRARQANVAARRAADDFEDADPCPRGCRCSLRPDIARLRKAAERAALDCDTAEKSWAEFCAAR